MADGTLRNYVSDETPPTPANATRGDLTTSSTANKPDVIHPPKGAKFFSIISTTTALRIQRDAVTDAQISGTLTAGKLGKLVADTPNLFPCDGPIALDSAGTSVVYAIHFSSRQP